MVKRLTITDLKDDQSFNTNEFKKFYEIRCYINNLSLLQLEALYILYICVCESERLFKEPWIPQTPLSVRVE